METSEVLNTAADVIEGRGWHNATTITGFADPWGGGASGTGPVCLEGGIMAALGMDTLNGGIPPREFVHCPSYAAVRDHLALGDRGMVFTWNDEQHRTAAEVIEVLRACALIELAKESALVSAVVA